jgi:hypothetical protein
LKYYCSSGGIFDYLKSIIRTQVGTSVGIEIGAEGHGVKAGRQRLQQDPIAVDNGRKPIAGLEASQGFEQRAQTQSKAARLALNSVREEVGNGLSIERDLKPTNGAIGVSSLTSQRIRSTSSVSLSHGGASRNSGAKDMFAKIGKNIPFPAGTSQKRSATPPPGNVPARYQILPS